MVICDTWGRSRSQPPMGCRSSTYQDPFWHRERVSELPRGSQPRDRLTTSPFHMIYCQLLQQPTGSHVPSFCERLQAGGSWNGNEMEKGLEKILKGPKMGIIYIMWLYVIIIYVFPFQGFLFPLSADVGHSVWRTIQQKSIAMENPDFDAGLDYIPKEGPVPSRFPRWRAARCW